MTRIQIAVAAAGPIKVKEDIRPAPMKSESKGKGKSKSRSPRQVFFSELMKRLAGDAGNDVSNAFKDDKKKFRGMMMGIVSEMSKVDGEEEE